MARKLVLALLCVAVAAVAARELQQAQVTVADLPKQLQQLNKRLSVLAAGAASKGVGPKKATVASFLESDSYAYGDEEEEEEPEYESYEAPKKHSYKAYKPKKHEDKKEYDEYEKEYKKYDDKKDYKKPEKYDKYEKEDSYGYYPKDKVTVKVYEKFRSHLRPQAGNANTFQFTSELTCQNPKAEYGPEHEDGIIGFPIVSERMKLVTIGVCEWTVTQVKEQRISEHATLKGNTQVVCSFTDEAERHCKNGDVLEEGLTLSGQGLAYNFDAEHEGYKGYKAAAAEEKEAPKAKDGEEEEGIDVYLTLINGVVNRSKQLKFDNGALQYFFGAPVAGFEKGRDASVRGATKKGDPTGEYTLVFKN